MVYGLSGAVLLEQRMVFQKNIWEITTVTIVTAWGVQNLNIYNKLKPKNTKHLKKLKHKE